jgi:uncharacterized membrane protein YeaQ/YmgE (transglycosylase-associated protein family)
MLFWLLVVCVALVVLLQVVGSFVSMLTSLLLGFLLGVLAKVVAPGASRLGLLLTTVAGVVGALLGGLAAEALGTGTVGTFLLQLLAAVLLVIALRDNSPRRRPSKKRATT